MTLWPSPRGGIDKQPFDRWIRPRRASDASDVEGQIHRSPELSMTADEIYRGVMQAILTSK